MAHDIDACSGKGAQDQRESGFNRGRRATTMPPQSRRFCHKKARQVVVIIDILVVAVYTTSSVYLFLCT